MREIDLSEWYGIAGNPDNIAIGKQLIDSVIQRLENGTDDEKEELEPLLLYYTESEFAEVMGILGFVLQNNEEVSVSAAVVSTVARHQLNKQLYPLSLAEIAMEQCELKTRVKSVLNKIDTMVEAK